MTRRFAPLDRAGQLNCAAEEQQFFGEGGFTSVGVGNNGEGAPPLQLCEELSHKSLMKQKLLVAVDGNNRAAHAPRLRWIAEKGDDLGDVGGSSAGV